MDGTNTNGNAGGRPLAENEHVKELLAALRGNGRDTAGLEALIGHIGEMEGFVRRAEEKIADMKSQLAELKEARDHPIATATRNAIAKLEKGLAAMRERLAALKEGVAEGCRNAMAAFKEKGLSAFDRLASFLNIKGGIEALGKGAAENAKQCDAAIARIDEISKQSRDAGRAIRNMARIVAGRDAGSEAKDKGSLAKAAAAPFKAQKALMLGISKTAGAMAGRLGQLENEAADRRGHRELDKPPPTLLGEVREAQRLVERRKLETPAPELSRARGAAEV
jgi:DNA-binding transcriptional MerR regulator